jgi:mannose-6-phosphate isomerase-like protein (cupin superfamily)
MVISLADSLQKLTESEHLFLEFFKHGTLSIEVYRPVNEDLQKPHAQDELYMIIAGTGDFFCGGERKPFKTGDILFVPAGVEHRFEKFSDDFVTWVIFYGPAGGEHK